MTTGDSLGPTRSSKALSRQEFDEVMRRAAELAASETEGDVQEVSEEEVFRIAREVGLDAHHVRSALGEVRSSAITLSDDGSASTWFDRVYGPAIVRTSRVVNGIPPKLADTLDEYMVAGRLLQRVRRGPVVLQYRPSVDWMSQIARAASGTARKYYLAASKSVEIHLHQVDGSRTHVEFIVDPGIQSDYAGGGIAISIFSGIAVGALAAAASATVLPIVAAVAVGGLAASGLVVGVTRVTRQLYRKKWSEVLAEVEGALDQLEMGVPMEPPPSSWRKWVERQFHGARRLLEQGGDTDADEYR